MKRPSGKTAAKAPAKTTRDAEGSKKAVSAKSTKKSSAAPIGGQPGFDVWPD